ncbi:MAG: family oxidoreductase [Acidobacteria bacterium]|nr:family oxidoreductase [Acidobacteriota bacterium]
MRTLIVTGGTGGLGGTVVARLTREYHCVVLYNSTVPAGMNVDGIHADLTDEASIRSAITQAADRFGPPYGLVHLAGGFAGGRVSETGSDDWQTMIGLNLTSSFVVIRETLGRMRRDEPGRIVAISSEATRTRPTTAAAYVISKTGLNLLIELTAAELAATPITANALLPGTLDTEAMRKEMPKARRVPLGTVAETIAFLLSDVASSISGALIPLRA